MENINPQQQQQKQRLSKQIANSQRNKSYLYNVDKKPPKVGKEEKKQRAASKSQISTSAKSHHHTSKSKVSKPTQVPVNNKSNNNTAKPINQSMPQVISFEEFKSIRRSGGTLPTLPTSLQSNSSSVMWSPTRDDQTRGNQQIGRVGKQQKGREGKKREQQQQQQQHMKKMMMQPMSFEQFKVMRRTGQLPLVPPVLPPPENSTSGNEQQQQRQQRKAGQQQAPQIMSFEEFKEMKRLLRTNNLEGSAHTTSKKSSRTVDKRGKKKKSTKTSSNAKAVNSSMKKKHSSGSKNKVSKSSSNKLQTIPKEVINTNQQQQKKENKKLSNRWNRKKEKEATKKKRLSIDKEVNVQVQEEEKQILSPIPEVKSELTPTASLTSGIDSVVYKEGSVKSGSDKSEAVVEDPIQDTSTFDIYSAMLNEVQPYLTTTSTKSMEKEEVTTKEKQVEIVPPPVVDSVDSTDENDEREDVTDEKDLAPDISMAVFDVNEEKTSVVGEDRIGFDSSSSNPNKVDDDVVGKDVTIPSFNETRKPLVRTLDFGDDIDKASAEVDVMEDQPVKMSDEIPKSESDDSQPKKGRILHIRTKRKINKGNFKKTMKKILPSLGRSKSNKAEQLTSTKQRELITNVKVFVPSPKADEIPVSPPSAMSIISVESIVVVSNDSGIIIKTTPPVTSDSLPQDLLYGAINYDFKNFDEQSDSGADVAQPVESPDEEEDSEIISVKAIEQARISNNDNGASPEVVAVVATEEDTKEIKIEVGSSDTPKTEAMKLTHSESTFQKEAETEEIDESILTKSNDISYLDEYQQALLASYVHDMDAEEEVDSDAEEDVEDNLQAPDTTHSDQASIAQSAIVIKVNDSSIHGSINHMEVEKEGDTKAKEEEPSIFIGDVNDEDEPVIKTKSHKSIKLSVETTYPSPAASSSFVSKKKSFEIQKRKIPSPKSRTTLFPKSASKKCSNGLVKSRISDIQQRIDALSSTSSFDNHSRVTGRYSYSHPLPSPTCSVSSATSSISSRMSSSSYIRSVPIGIAKTYSQNLDSPSGSVIGLGFGNSTLLDIDNDPLDERVTITAVSYAQKYMK